MFFVLVGIAGLLLKYLEIAPVAELSWWTLLIPFGLAVAWWSWADATGYTKRKAMEKMDERKKERLAKQQEAIGTLKKRR